MYGVAVVVKDVQTAVGAARPFIGHPAIAHRHQVVAVAQTDQHRHVGLSPGLVIVKGAGGGPAAHLLPDPHAGPVKAPLQTLGQQLRLHRARPPAADRARVARDVRQAVELAQQDARQPRSHLHRRHPGRVAKGVGQSTQGHQRRVVLAEVIDRADAHHAAQGAGGQGRGRRIEHRTAQRVPDHKGPIGQFVDQRRHIGHIVGEGLGPVAAGLAVAPVAAQLEVPDVKARGGQPGAHRPAAGVPGVAVLGEAMHQQHRRQGRPARQVFAHHKQTRLRVKAQHLFAQQHLVVAVDALKHRLRREQRGHQPTRLRSQRESRPRWW